MKQTLIKVCLIPTLLALASCNDNGEGQPAFPPGYKITLSWEAPSDSLPVVRGYMIYVNTDSAPSSTTWLDSGRVFTKLGSLPPGDYKVWVKALNNAGVSESSDTLHFKVER